MGAKFGSLTKAATEQLKKAVAEERERCLKAVIDEAEGWTDDSALGALADVAQAITGEEWNPRADAGIEKVDHA